MPWWAVGGRKFRGRDILVFKSNRNRLLCTHHWLLHFSIEISILRPICKYRNSWAAGSATAVTAAGAAAVTALPPRRSVRGAAAASVLPDKWRERGTLKKKKPQDFVGCLLDTRLKARFFQAERRLMFPQLNGKTRHGQKRKNRMESFLSVVFLRE